MENRRILLLLVLLSCIVIAGLLFDHNSAVDVATPRRDRHDHADADADGTSSTAAAASSSSSSLQKAKRKKQPRKPRDKSVLCVLPVGDSLTQGVAHYRGYRAFLNRSLVTRSASSSSPLRFRFVGSTSGTCVIGKPQQIYRGGGADGFARELHEGHCSWGARLLRERLDSVVVDGGEPKQKTTITAAANLVDQNRLHSCIITPSDETSGDASSSPPPIQLRVDVALLMIGHNNVFQCASVCKLKEGKALPDDVRLWLRGFRGFGTPSEKALTGALPSRLLCAWKVLRTEFFPHLSEMIETLLGKSNSGATNSGTRVIVGLNPPTGFPNLDPMLHAIIRTVVSEKAQRFTGASRVSVAEFPGFGGGGGAGKVKHTFDSTHPNDAGARVIARGWDAALAHELEDY